MNKQAHEHAREIQWDTEEAFEYAYSLLEECNMATEARALKDAHESMAAYNATFAEANAAFDADLEKEPSERAKDVLEIQKFAKRTAASAMNNAPELAVMVMNFKNKYNVRNTPAEVTLDALYLAYSIGAELPSLDGAL